MPERPRMSEAAAGGATEITSLEPGERDGAIPIVIDAFSGVYRWHAKRTLREARWVRAARAEGRLVGVAMLEPLNATVGYVYYIAVRADCRRRGVARRLLDDALRWLRAHGSQIAYAVVTEGNAPSESLFRSRGFRPIEREEASYQDGGLGARGLRSRMRIVRGERLMGRRLSETDPTPAEGPIVADPPSGSEPEGADGG